MGRLIRMLRNTFIFLVLGLFFFGCSTENSQRVVVYAASSLTDVLNTLEIHFEKDHPDIEIAAAFAGSQALRLQIQQGAPAHTFISANPQHMASLKEQGRVGQVMDFAYNRLAVIVPKDNPANIQVASDLVKANRLVMGSAQVPIGQYARRWLLKADEEIGRHFSKKVLGQIVSEENNVRLLRAKVELGEADAAIVYLTDARSSKSVQHIPIQASMNIRTQYQLGIVAQERSNPALETWLNFLNSDVARELMKQEGLELP